MSLLLSILGLCILVVLHELGHFFAAKASGMKVHEFAVGFGPKVFSFQWGETQFAFRIILLGGYVRIAGMHPSEEDAEDPQGFLQSAPWKRFASILAGPIANYITAFVIFAGLFFFVGISDNSLQVQSVKKDSLAALVGLKAKDKILAVNQIPIHGDAGKPLTSQFVEHLSTNKKQILLSIRRDHRVLSLELPWKKNTKLGIQAQQESRLVWLAPKAPAVLPKGVEVGDLILSAQEIKILSKNSIQQLQKNKKGNHLTFRVLRKNQIISYRLLLSELSLESLKETTELVIREVKTGSLAQEGGLEKRDTILSVNGKKLQHQKILFPLQQLEKIVSSCKTEDLRFVVLRNRSKQELLWKKNPAQDCTLGLNPRKGSFVEIGYVVKKSLAAQKGLRVGDRVYKINQEEVTTVPQFIHLVQSRQFQKITFHLKRGKQKTSIEFEKMKPQESWKLGIMPIQETRYQKISASLALSTAFSSVIQWNQRIWGGLSRIFSGKEKANLTGPVGIVKQATESVQLGWVRFLTFMAIISIHLAFFNLLPIPALDGGRIVFLLTQQVLRLFGFKEEWGIKAESIANLIGFALLFSMLLFVTFKDLFG